MEKASGAVSRYKFCRRQKIVTVQDFNYRQMRALPTEVEGRWVSGCNGYYKFVLSAGAKVEDPPVAETKSRLGGAKSVTNNLPILSVLAFRCYF